MATIEPVSAASERREALKAVYRAGARLHALPAAGRDPHAPSCSAPGNADADLMFVGEAPGRTRTSRACRSSARPGKLLDKLLGEIGLAREDVFICNT